MAAKNLIIKEYARMWPREVFCLSEKGKQGKVVKGLELVNQQGVYVLYRDGVPYYVGKARYFSHWINHGTLLTK